MGGRGQRWAGWGGSGGSGLTLLPPGIVASRRGVAVAARRRLRLLRRRVGLLLRLCGRCCGLGHRLTRRCGGGGGGGLGDSPLGGGSSSSGSGSISGSGSRGCRGCRRRAVRWSGGGSGGTGCPGLALLRCSEALHDSGDPNGFLQREEGKTHKVYFKLKKKIPLNSAMFLPRHRELADAGSTGTHLPFRSGKVLLYLRAHVLLDVLI